MSDTCVIQVTNIAPSATNEQMKTLFSYLGTIKEIVVYPNEDSSISTTSRVCYIRFADNSSVGVAQHLTNTVFVDRALIVLPFEDGKIPDAATAMSLTSGGPHAGGSNSGVVSQVITGVGGAQVITTIDPRLTALGLPQYPPLPANMDPTKIEEIRRTVYVGNLDSTLSAEQLLTFFNQMGEVKYIRMAGDETQPTRFAFVEFTDQSSVANALQYNGVIFGGRPLKINHSNNSIVKPQAKSSEAAQKEIEEAMKRVREAQSLISAAIEPGFSMKFDKILEIAGKEKSKSRSRSRSRRRSTSRSTRRRSRSRTRRSRSRGRRRRSRSRSLAKRRSRSHERRRSRSRDKDRDRRHRRRSRERSRDRETDRHSRRRSRSRDKDKEMKKRRHSRSRSRSKRREDKSKDVEKLRETPVSQTSEVETKPEGPELPPEDIKSEVTESIDLEVRSTSISPEVIKSPRKSVSVSPPRKYSSRRSRSPKRRSRSPERKRSRTPTKSHKKKRERDRDRERERERDRSRSRDRRDKKKRRRDRDSIERTARELKVKRDYDEEEKGYDSKDDDKDLHHSSHKSYKTSDSPID